MSKTYTETELQDLLEKSGNQINVAELDRKKVYIFRIRCVNGMSKDTASNIAKTIKDLLDKLGIKSMVLIDNAIEIYELDKN